MKDVLWSILKILGFILLLPLIIASIIAFQTQILSLPVDKEVWVLWGAGSYVALNLFIYDFKAVYTAGNSFVEKILPTFKPACFIIPVFSIILIILNTLAWVIGRGGAWQPYFLFAIAFTLTMHVVLTAHEIYQSDNSVLKAHYFAVFGIVLVVSFFIMSLLLTWAIPQYSFVAYVKSLGNHTAQLYHSVYRALFVDS